ncbi:hypothetical protein H0H87_011910 [Tephrocybe sp. NHM501043]|nr:hypothetical protein H0H87_011910 [Tephrocybe sp. NHM501043]
MASSQQPDQIIGRPRRHIQNRKKKTADLQAQVADLQTTVAQDRFVHHTEAERVADHGDELPMATYDKPDGVYRCIDCVWEVIEDKDYPYEPKDSLHTELAYDSDREQAPRGYTPLPDIGCPSLPLLGYSLEQYTSLVQRGATRLMIETFNLQFTNEAGIFAWADSTLYAEFAGPKMREGDFWKIQLGRRFDLDDNDLDGAGFIEGILEDAILFPGKGGLQWETVEESPGIWVTRTVETGDVDEREKNNGEDEWPWDEDELEGKTLHEVEDEHLTQPFIDDGPVLTRPGYDTSDDHSSDDEEMIVDEEDGQIDENMSEDTGAAFQAHLPDAAWDTDNLNLKKAKPGELTSESHDDAGDNNNHDEQIGVKSEAEDAGSMVTLDSDSDIADSDFDDDEIMSGDEEVMRSVYLHFYFAFTQTLSVIGKLNNLNGGLILNNDVRVYIFLL